MANEIIRQKIKHESVEAVGAVKRAKNEAESSTTDIERSVEGLNQINVSIQEVSDMSVQIATAIEEQSLVVEEINRNICNLSTGADGVTFSSIEMDQASAGLKELTNEFSLIIGQFQEK